MIGPAECIIDFQDSRLRSAEFSCREGLKDAFRMAVLERLKKNERSHE